MSQIPWIDHLLDKNPLLRIGPKPTLTSVVDIFEVVAQYREELRERSAEDAGEKRPLDFLNRCVQLKEQKPEGELGGLEVDDKQIINWLTLNILAGGDTTSATMRAAMHYLAKTPSNCSKLIAELDAAVWLYWRIGRMPKACLTWTQSFERLLDSTLASPWSSNEKSPPEACIFPMAAISLEAPRLESTQQSPTAAGRYSARMRMNGMQTVGYAKNAKPKTNISQDWLG